MANFRSLLEFQTPLRFNLSEWIKENNYHVKCAEDHCKLAERVRADSLLVQENTLEILEKNKNETNTRFNERINEEKFVRDEIERIGTKLQLELDPLNNMRNRIEAALKSIESCNYNITQRCRFMREGRIGIDLVHDDVETALLKECKTIEGALVILRRCLNQIKESERLVRSSLYLMNKDLRCKMTAINIDKEALSLKETDVSLSVYEGKIPLDPEITTIEEWISYTAEEIRNATAKLDTTRLLRVYIDSVLKQIEWDLRAQDQAVNEAFRLRINEVKLRKNKLEMQHFEVVRQANETALGISGLQKAIGDKEGYLALSHTRLGKRSQRPGVELVRDEVTQSLAREVLDIKAAIAQLRQKLAQAEAVQRQLLKTQVQLQEDINIKINSLKIDEVDCMTLRQSIQHPVL